jgi:hypothetical protein
VWQTYPTRKKRKLQEAERACVGEEKIYREA